MDLSLSPAAKQKLKNFLICFSLGNLCFLRRWYDLEHLKERSMDYYRTGPADPTLLFATIISGILLTCLFWLAWQWVERDRKPWKMALARCVFLLMLLYSIESIRRYWELEVASDLATNLSIFAIETILGVGIVLALFGNTRIVRAASRMALLLTLLLPSFMIDFTWNWINAEPRSAYEPKPPAPLISHNAPPRRVVWLLFDEFDQRIAFDARPDSVQLPELDRLRAESVVANQVTQTADWTMLALPSLLSGRIFTAANLIDADELRLYPEGSKQSVNWRDQPNVFRQARALGLNAALVGWHHPYCRVLGDSVVRCLDVPSSTIGLLRETSVAEKGLLKSIPFLFYLQLLNLVDLVRPGSASLSNDSRDAYVQPEQQRQYFRIRDTAYSAAADPQIDFLFVHFPTPHLFAIYDRHRGDFSLDASTSYLDNLALVDRTVGEIRQKLEQAGLWDRTSLIITSDHGLRPSMWQGRRNWTPEIQQLTTGNRSETVPFIVKLAARNQGAVYGKPFSNLICGELVLAMLTGQVSNAAAASAWLDEHAALSGKSLKH